MNPEIKIIIEFRSQEEVSLSTMDIPHVTPIAAVDHGTPDAITSFMSNGVQYCKSKACYWTITDDKVKDISRSAYYKNRQESDYVK